MADDHVGYGRPPRSGQFQKGRSGNPKGRPKNTRNFKTDLQEELREQIPIRENGREKKISKQRAFIKALVAAAIKGDMRATNALVSFCTRALGADQADATPAAETEDIDIVEAFLAREQKRRRHISKTAKPKKE